MTDRENWPVQSPWGGYSIDLTKLKNLSANRTEEKELKPEIEEKEQDA